MRNSLNNFPFFLMLVVVFVSICSSPVKADDNILDLIVPVLSSTAKNTPTPNPPINPHSVNLSSAVSYVPQKIELGWFNLTPCTRTEWVAGNPLGFWKTETAPQEVHVYATINAPKFDNLSNYVAETVRQAFQDTLNSYFQGAFNNFKNGLGQCALVAAGSAGVAALASYGAGAISTFTGVFTPCMNAEIDVLLAYFSPTNITTMLGNYLTIVYGNISDKLKADISSSVAFSSETICRW